MNLDKKREQIQDQALQAWIQKNKKGTVEIITGLGKTMIAMKAIMTMPKGCSVLWLAETNQRWKDVKDDIINFKKFYNIDIYEHVDKIEMFCYQSAYKWTDKHFDIVIADEIHDGLTLEYSKFFLYNTYNSIIGLSATINRKTVYKTESGEEITKGELIDNIAPICFKYSVNQGQEDGTARKLNIHVINHNLDFQTKNVLAGSKTKQFLTTEKNSYDYWDNEFKKSLFLPASIKEFKLRVTSSARARILYNLPSKVVVTKKLLEVLSDKTIVFGNSIEALLQVTPNVISSKNSELKNSDIRNKFDSGEYDIIGSFKMLKQGANLKGLTNAVIMSYYSVEKDITQMIGKQFA
jgi:superfamily II DNA or RNA helicase